MGELTVKVPDVGEGVAEAELVELHVKVGDVVREDDVLVAVMTDKATVEIPSPYAGTVAWIGADVGEKIAVGADLLRLNGASQSSSEGAEIVPSKVKAPTREEHKVVDLGRKDPAPPPVPVSQTRPEKASVGTRSLAAPSVRQRARDAGIDLGSVRGTGPGGRILHSDVEQYAPRGSSDSGYRIRTDIKEIKVVGLRRKIAEKMTLSKSRIPHITIVEEVDVTAVEELRASLTKQLTDGARLTFLPFLMRAMVKALGAQPNLNALYDDEAGVIRQHASINIGVATQTPGGLVVPVVRNVEARSLLDCAREVERLAGKARDGSATRDELIGSTITITSLGALGAIATTPVINYPEVAIVGVNRMAIRPMWNGSVFVPRKMMNLSSSFDHRVIDGWDAALFVQKLKDLLEKPAEMFIDLNS